MPRASVVRRSRVETRAAQRVDQTDTVGTCRLDRADRLAEVPRMRRKLGVERVCGRLTAGGDDLGGRLRRLVDVRAREVQLDRHAFELRARLRVLVRSEATDRHPQRHAERRATAAAFATRNASRPGFAKPIAFSIPKSVSAMRTGAFPSRGSGVTVFVTNASSDCATSGAVQRVEATARVQEQREHRSFDTQSLQLVVDLDDAAVARAVAAGHRRLPRELRVRARARAPLRASVRVRTRARRARRAAPP